jgi:hypothetical protein
MPTTAGRREPHASVVVVDVVVVVEVVVVVDVEVLVEVAAGRSVTFIHSGAISSRSRFSSDLPGWPK